MKSTATLQSFISPALTYSNTLRRPEIPVDEDMSRFAKNLLSIIEILADPTPDMDRSKDWIAEANAMLPSAFAKRFVCEVDPVAQRIAREIKVRLFVFRIMFEMCSD